MTEEPKQTEENAVMENLVGVGQRILGTLESIGGVLTADPIANAEGELNSSIGAMHQENSRVLIEAEREELSERNTDPV